MKLKLLFLAWSIYLWLGIQSGDPMQLFFAGFFLLLHIGAWCQRREMHAEKVKVRAQPKDAKSVRK